MRLRFARRDKSTESREFIDSRRIREETGRGSGLREVRYYPDYRLLLPRLISPRQQQPRNSDGSNSDSNSFCT